MKENPDLLRKKELKINNTIKFISLALRNPKTHESAERYDLHVRLKAIAF